ncbi:MAG TPA: GNAT family N-acetyltransferase [Methanotrichaceae archaeon]|nr:GNAT family N-acetyltransferase [Methanotrichaceae archaeon]
MTRPDVQIGQDWAAKEGWNPGRYDADSFYSADPDGFFLGEIDGLPIGCISAVRHDDSFGFLGCYFIVPEFRKRGYGIRIWNTAIAHLAGRNAGLDSVMSQEEIYRRSGFKRAYFNLRFQGLGGGAMPSGVVRLSDVPFEEIAEYDCHLFPAPRPSFLWNWIRLPHGASFGVLKNGHLSGYGVIRACKVGFKIGPLFADDEKIAETLFLALASHADSAVIFMDVPEVNPAAVALAERHGMKKFMQAVRMYSKGTPDMPMDRIFCVTTLQLG